MREAHSNPSFSVGLQLKVKELIVVWIASCCQIVWACVWTIPTAQGNSEDQGVGGSSILDKTPAQWAYHDYHKLTLLCIKKKGKILLVCKGTLKKVSFFLKSRLCWYALHFTWSLPHQAIYRAGVSTPWEGERSWLWRWGAYPIACFWTKKNQSILSCIMLFPMTTRGSCVSWSVLSEVLQETIPHTSCC